MGQEYRKFKRFATDIMKVNGKMMFASTVEIIDISTGGISLHIDRALKIGSEYMFRIDANNRSISVKGTVVWSTLRESRKNAEGDSVPVYSVGMRFRDLAAENIADLLKFIESNKEEQSSEKRYGLSGLRINMRFHVVTDGKFMLTCPEDFSVKKISLGGMLIETGQPLEIEERLPMVIFLPGESEIAFTGRIASCIPIESEGPKQFDIGIEFLEMSDESVEKLSHFIRTLVSQ